MFWLRRRALLQRLPSKEAGKRARSGTEVSSAVSGSEPYQRAPPRTDGQDGEGWTLVKRRRRGQRKRQENHFVDSRVAGPATGPTESPPARKLEQQEMRVPPQTADSQPQHRQPRTSPHLSRRQRRRQRRQMMQPGYQAHMESGPTSNAAPTTPQRPARRQSPRQAAEGNFKASAVQQPGRPPMSSNSQTARQQGQPQLPQMQYTDGQAAGGNSQAPAAQQP